MKMFGSYWVRRAQLALIGLAIWFIATCGGCAATVFDGTAPVVPFDDTPDAVVDAARSVLALYTGDARCSATVIGDLTALSDRHCYDAPTDPVLGFLQSPTLRVVFVERGAQLNLGADIVTLSLSINPEVPLAVVAAHVPEPNTPVWMAGHGCPAAREARAPLVHVGMLDSTFGNSLAIRNLQPATCGGDSGGGVFNAAGELIGLLRSYDVDSNGHYVWATKVGAR